MKTNYLTLLTFITSGLLLCGCSQPESADYAQNGEALDGNNVEKRSNVEMVSFKIFNSASEDFKNAPFILSKAQVLKLGLQFNELESKQVVNVLVVSNAGVSQSTKHALISQQDDLDGDGIWDEIAFLVDVPGKTELELTLTTGTLPKAQSSLSAVRTNIRLAQYTNEDKSEVIEFDSVTRQSAGLQEEYAKQFQMEGPSWENDNIGFRLYFDERNGIDIFGKTNTDMVLDGAGIGENYHELQDWGMDILKVGRSLGAGALAFASISQGAINEVPLQRIANAVKTRAKIVSEGPVRSILDIDYEKLPMAYPQASTVNLRQRISIWAAQHYYSVELILSDTEKSSAIAVGIVNLHDVKANQSIHNGHAVLVSYGAQAEGQINLGMAVVGLADDHVAFGNIGATDQGIEYSFFNAFALAPERPLHYQFYAVWQSRMQDINSEDGFIGLIEHDLMRKQSLSISVGD